MRNKPEKKSPNFEKNKEKIRNITKSNIKMLKDTLNEEKKEYQDYAACSTNSEWYIG